MTSPRLPMVEQAAAALAVAVVNRAPTIEALWHVGGPPTSGKSALLHHLSSYLSDEGLWAITVAPPARELDAGPAALVEIGSALKARNAINGQLDSLIDPGRPWADKLADVRRWLDERRDKVVLLCDEPLEWAARATEDVHFAAKTWEVANLLLGMVSCRRVIVGQLPPGQKPLRSERLYPSNEPAGWLLNANVWGSLVESARLLQAQVGDALPRYSPLEVRLLVALVAISDVAEIKAWLPHIETRRAISGRLAAEISQQPDLRPLSKIWASLAFVRRPFAGALLRVLGSDQLDERASDLLTRCLLYTQRDEYILHETLRADARAEKWLDERSARTVHARLAEHYAVRFKRAIQSMSDPQTTLLDEMEAYHHATRSGSLGLMEQLRPFFVVQLDAFGRALSKDLKDYSGAVTVFKKALEWDASDGYAHHYLAFNLDVQGRDWKTVEQHYQQAIELDPDHAWWRSRYINYLITRGRVAEARRAWDEALDALNLPDPDADPSIYENLHLWVARLLLHRGQLDFAEAVLDGIPAEVRDTHPGLRATERRLTALLEARRTGAFVPGPHLTSDWWKQGPFLLQRQLMSGHKLVRWLAARVEEVSGGELHLRVAIVPANSDSDPEIGRLPIPFKTFNKWNPDEPASRLESGRFVEIGTYVKGPKAKGSVETHARVHPDRAWDDNDLPPLFPNPTRYIARRPRSGD